MIVFDRTLPGLGDGITLEPLVEIAYEKCPTEEIAMRTLEWIAPIWQHHPHVNRVYTEKDAPPEGKYLLQIGTNGEADENDCPCALYECSHMPDVRKGRIELHAEAAGLEYDGRAPKLYLSPKELEQTEKIRKRFQGYNVGIHLRSTERYRTYPHNNLLIKYLRHKTDWNLFLIDSRPVPDIPNTVALSNLPIRELMTYLKALDLLIAPDSGIIWLAGALGVRLYGIFGATDPRVRIKVFGDKARWNKRYTACKRSYCWYETCKDAYCLKSLNPGAIYNDVRKYYGQELGIKSWKKRIGREIKRAIEIIIKRPKGVLFDTITGCNDRGWGDIIISTALMKKLKQTYGLVHYAVRDGGEAILKNNPYIDKIITGNLDVFRYEQELKLERKIEDYRDEINCQPRIDAMAKHFGITDYDKVPRLYLSDNEKEYGKKFYQDDKVNVGVNIEATSYTRRYPVRYLAKIIECMDKDLYHIHLFGQNPIIHELSGKEKITDHINTRDLRQSISIANAMDIIFTTDSLFSHIAGALDIPSVVMYTTIDKEWRSKYYKRCLAIQSPYWCSPCMDRQTSTCTAHEDQEYPDCMWFLKPENMFQAIEKQVIKYYKKGASNGIRK